MIIITEVNHEEENEIMEYKNKIIDLISILSKVSDILDDDTLIDFINEETDNYWNIPREINDYLEALRNIIY